MKVTIRKSRRNIRVRKYKYSGVVMYNKRLTSLTTKHVSEIRKKAERRVNFIGRLGFQGDSQRPT